MARITIPGPDGAPMPLRHRWRFDMNFLCGISAGAWWRLLRTVGFDLDFAYAHRVAQVSALSLLNSALGLVEDLRTARAVAATPLPERPVFVMGHFRQGTTQLHNLLAQDPRFSFPTTFSTMSPSSFLSFEGLGSRLFGAMLPATRPQDQIKLAFDLPQEDEYAIALLSGVSPLLGFVFPRRERFFRRHLSLRDATDAERAAWTDAFLRFLRKLASRDPRPPVLKSPEHTARARLIHQLLPGARFVHIHRDPYEVFLSTRHLVDSAAWFQHLQLPDLSGRDEGILAYYTEMYDAWFEDVEALPPGQVVEIGYRELSGDPLGALERVYEGLDLGDFGAAEPHFRRYLDQERRYERNRYAPLTEAERARVTAAWGRSFARWGYAV